MLLLRRRDGPIPDANHEGSFEEMEPRTLPNTAYIPAKRCPLVLSNCGYPQDAKANAHRWAANKMYIIINELGKYSSVSTDTIMSFREALLGQIVR